MISKFRCLKKFDWDNNTDRHCIFNTAGRYIYDLIISYSTKTVSNADPPAPVFRLQKYHKYESFDSDHIFGNDEFLIQMATDFTD